MERGTEFRPVTVWKGKLFASKNQDIIELNREIRNWLARNIGSGTWETKLTLDEKSWDTFITITFDIEAEEDAMAFKLRWL